MLTHAITCTLLSLITLTTATQLFSNHGTKAGWDGFNQENQGTVQEVNNVYLEASSALKMTQIFTPHYTGRYHSEAYVNNGYKKGDERFYGFSFRLQQDWDTSGDQSYNIAQWIADFTHVPGTCDDWMPSSMIWVKGNQLYSRLKYGSDTCHEETTPSPALMAVVGGTWYTVIVQASWQADGTGYYKIWVDGQKVWEIYNTPTTLDSDVEFSFRVGLYANGWHDQNDTLEGGQGTRQVWIDEVAIGTTYADVDPAKWRRKRGVEWSA